MRAGAGLTDAEDAFCRYEAIRARLPRAQAAGAGRAVPSLEAVADAVDGFLLDAYGVLNVGDRAVPGAVARMAALRARGKRLVVLTNAASFPRAQLVAKYRRLGFDFAPDEVVSSRDVAMARLEALLPGATWAAIGAAGDRFPDCPARVLDAIDDPGALDAADGILFLSTLRWTAALQARLHRALLRRPRPMVVANPDLVAPCDPGLSLEPGLYAHALLDAMPLQVHWIGKPFVDVFAAALARMGLPPQRVAMVGDTLHTDVLGAAAAGCRSVLVTRHGLFAGRAAEEYVARSGIVPDYVCPDP